jgi:hypothetical protein
MFREIGLVTGKNAKIVGRDARPGAFWGRFNRGAQGKICVKINF